MAASLSLVAIVDEWGAARRSASTTTGPVAAMTVPELDAGSGVETGVGEGGSAPPYSWRLRGTAGLLFVHAGPGILASILFCSNLTDRPVVPAAATARAAAKQMSESAAAAGSGRVAGGGLKAPPCREWA